MTTECLSTARKVSGMTSDDPGKDPPEPATESASLLLQRLLGISFLHPLVTRLARTVAVDDSVRVEHNVVHNVATKHESQAVRVMPLDDVHHASIVVPVLLDGRLTLVGRYRYATGRWSIELPRADFESDDRGWKHPAETLLRQSSGLAATKMTLLGAIQTDSAISGISTIVVLAEGCQSVQQAGANPRDLIAGSVAMEPAELDRLVRRGEITCGATLAALYLYAAHLSR
jgi:hypothetical protein